MPEGKPTPKQLAFAEHIAMGLNPSDAYRAAGYRANKPETVATEAYRLMHNPKISPIIAEMKSEAMQSAVITRTALLDRLEAINKQAFEEVSENNISECYRAFQAFMQTFKALDDLEACESWYGIAKSEAITRVKASDVFRTGFEAQEVWFTDGE